MSVFSDEGANLPSPAAAEMRAGSGSQKGRAEVSCAGSPSEIIRAQFAFWPLVIHSFFFFPETAETWGD